MRPPWTFFRKREQEISGTFLRAARLSSVHWVAFFLLNIVLRFLELVLHSSPYGGRFMLNDPVSQC